MAQAFDLEGRQTFGRQAKGHVPDISSSARTVSRSHGLFEVEGETIRFTDTGSKNGTSLNDNPLKPGTAVMLEDGNVLRIHPLNSPGTEHDVVMVAAMNYPAGMTWSRLGLGSDIRSLEVGRSQAISIGGSAVSRRHATFFHAENGWAIIDNQSLNGVYLNGHRIREPILLRPMDVIWIAEHIFVFLGDMILYQRDAAGRKAPAALHAGGSDVKAEGLQAVADGSDAKNGGLQAVAEGSDVKAEGLQAMADRIDEIAESLHPGADAISEDYEKKCSADSEGGDQRAGDKAAPEIKTEQKNTGFMFADSLSFLDESPLKADSHEAFADYRGSSSGNDSEKAVSPENRVHAADTPDDSGRKMPEPEKRKRVRGERSLYIQIEERNVWNRLRKKTILRDINLQIEGGSLVLILGGSGAGKTTFMNAVMGYEPAKGRVVYGNNDIYREYEKMKYEIGYVPQQDLLRMEDVVYDTLDNAAHMRLPDSLPPQQREMRVQQTLEMFGLSRESGSLVGKLSGGQRKRLSIAVEYIGNPSLFFLDEPDSGLDGIMAKELMAILRQIADQGKIVMVISHSPDRAFDLFDKVIVLAKSSTDDSGRLIYYGEPAAACAFFGTSSLEGIVGRINRKDEGGEGLADYFLNRAKGN